jgi:hypothetical protein
MQDVDCYVSIPFEVAGKLVCAYENMSMLIVSSSSLFNIRNCYKVTHGQVISSEAEISFHKVEENRKSNNCDGLSTS